MLKDDSPTRCCSEIRFPSLTCLVNISGKHPVTDWSCCFAVPTNQAGIMLGYAICEMAPELLEVIGLVRATYMTYVNVPLIPVPPLEQFERYWRWGWQVVAISWQLVHCIELLPTPLPQTPQGHLTAFSITFWHSPFIKPWLLWQSKFKKATDNAEPSCIPTFTCYGNCVHSWIHCCLVCLIQW